MTHAERLSYQGVSMQLTSPYATGKPWLSRMRPCNPIDAAQGIAFGLTLGISLWGIAFLIV